MNKTAAYTGGYREFLVGFVMEAGVVDFPRANAFLGNIWLFSTNTNALTAITILLKDYVQD